MRVLRGERRVIPGSRASDETVIWHGEIKLVTPLLGGGHTSGQVDEKRPIRASAIRGHLRFWWRATHGVLMPSIEEMRQREDLIFGAPARKKSGKIEGGRGLVKVQVGSVGKAQAKDLRGSPLAKSYAAAILVQGSSTDGKELTYAENVSVNLKVTVVPAPTASALSSESIHAEVAGALKAWMVFGGYGSRSRRGLGCVAPGKVLADPYKMETASYADFSAPHGEKRITEVPSLVGAKVFFEESPVETPIEAWARALTLYQLIRKGTSAKGELKEQFNKLQSPFKLDDFQRNAQSVLQWTAGQYMASGWPEISWLSEGTSGSAPRIQFGLPYRIYRAGGRGANEVNVEFRPQLDTKSSRVASPVLVRPLRVTYIDRKTGQQRVRWVASLIVLSMPPIGGNNFPIYAYEPNRSREVESVVLRRGDGCLAGDDEYFKDQSNQANRELLVKTFKQKVPGVTNEQINEFIKSSPGNTVVEKTLALMSKGGLVPIFLSPDDIVSLDEYVSQVLKRADIDWKEHKL